MSHYPFQSNLYQLSPFEQRMSNVYAVYSKCEKTWNPLKHTSLDLNSLYSFKNGRAKVSAT